MNFGEFLKIEREKNKLSARQLSSRIGKSSTYIYSLEKGLFNPDYVIATKIINELNLNMHEEEILSLLHSFEIQTPFLNSDKDSWGTQEKEDTKDDIPHASDFYNKEDRDEQEDLRNFISNEEMNYNSKYSYKKKKEMEDTINQIGEKLTSFLNESFDAEDYSKTYDTEKILSTLRGLFNIDNNNPTIYRFFLRLLSIPLHSVTNVNLQKEIIYSIEKLCQSEYVFNKLSEKDNDPVDTNYLSVETKQPLKK